MAVKTFKELFDEAYERVSHTSSQKVAYGYYNFEWSGNDVLLHSRDQKQTIHLTGDAAKKFTERVTELEEDIPHDVSLEDAVNDLISSYFKK